MSSLKFYTKGEEIANAVTHGIGALLSISAIVLLAVFSVKYGNVWDIVSNSIFGTTLFLLYLGSTLYHSFTGEKVKKVFRVIDHAAIYLLIAGTYTPFTLSVIKRSTGWWIFGVIWGLTTVGITLKVFFTGKFDKLSTFIYVGMGWMIVFAFKSIVQALPMVSVILLVAGGVVYTAGCFFYLKNKIPFNHAIWHMFVLGGSACHVLSLIFNLTYNS